MRAVIQAVMPYDLHGVRHYQVVYLPDGSAQPVQARLSYDMIYDGARPGDAIEVHSLLNIVERITRAEFDA
jgi:hypothetical protein